MYRDIQGDMLGIGDASLVRYTLIRKLEARIDHLHEYNLEKLSDECRLLP